METRTVRIADLKEIPELKHFYAPQPNDYVESYKLYGQKTPIHINSNLEIINGYRMVEAIKNAGGETVNVIILDGNPDIHDRIILNHTRIKTTDDTVREIKEVFKKFPKRRGERNLDGSTYCRHELISASLGSRWKGDNMIKMLDYIIDKDFEDNTLLKGIVEGKYKVETCNDYLEQFKDVDIKNNYGFTERIKSGEITVSDANRLIERRSWLDKDYKHTFIMRDNCRSHNIDCIELGKMSEYRATIDLLLTSVPYFDLRNYPNGDPNQIGHEATKEEYCENIAKVFAELLPMLKDSANVMINIGETYNNGVGLGIVFLLKHYIETRTKLIYKEMLIWSKPNPKPQSEAVQRPINKVEYILWFVVNVEKAKWKLLTYPVKDKEIKICRGAKDVSSDGTTGKKRISLAPNYGKIYNHLKEQEIADIIECSVGKNHDVYKIYEEGTAAIMSPLLPVVPILMTTDEDDVVFDPFSGSNVVGRMTCLLNRKALSAELSKRDFSIGCQMLKQSFKDFDRNSLDLIQGEVYQKTNVEEDQSRIAA
jgi:DNA modification methylase